MESASISEENLREAAAVGNLDQVQALVRQGVNVNSKNATNGWTALHWASKRGRQTIAEFLLQNGADASIQNANGETCLQLAENSHIRLLLGGEAAASGDHHITALPIVPNYISNPLFPYVSGPNNHSMQNSEVSAAASPFVDEVVLKIRVANCDEKDFIEVDIPRRTTFSELVALMRSELAVDAKAVVQKVRKLPDTIMRNDRDVRRLRDYQELELVLRPHWTSLRSLSSDAASYKATVSPKRIDVVY